MKRPIFSLLARTCTHALQEFSSFCCHKCHTRLCSVLLFRLLWCIFECVLTNKFFCEPNTEESTARSVCFLPVFLGFLFLLFPSSLFVVWHLWQQKNNIAVGRRARTRTWGVVPRFSVLRMKTSTCLHAVRGGGTSMVRERVSLRYTKLYYFLIMICRVFKNWCDCDWNVIFLRFFPSLGQYLPIYI